MAGNCIVGSFVNVLKVSFPVVQSVAVSMVNLKAFLALRNQSMQVKMLPWSVEVESAKDIKPASRPFSSPWHMMV